ncbi:MAG: hypothetical protein WBG54_18705 [Acidobacteriaceae bacterium]
MEDPITGWSTFALAILSVAGVGISYWGIRKQARSFAASVSADLCLKLLDRFESREMQIVRSNAATALRARSGLRAADDVFDFFEIIGLYVRLGTLDKELAHSFFFHWINLYWHVGKEYIFKSRKRSSEIYRDFEGLYRTVLEIEMKNDPKSRDLDPTDAEVDSFLAQEIG